MKTEEQKFAQDEINEQSDAGAVLVSKEQAEARKSVCMECKELTNLNPLPLLVIKGCGICLCPLATKPHFRRHFSLSAGQVIKTECPHPDGNKWAEVDNRF